MTKSELNKFKNILEAKQAELAQFVRNREGIAIEKSPDALDEVQHAAERELAIRNLDRESNLLRNVRAALRRIDEGTFGVCLHCEEDISPEAAGGGAVDGILHPVPGDRRSQSGGRRLRSLRRPAGQRGLISSLQSGRGPQAGFAVRALGVSGIDGTVTPDFDFENWARPAQLCSNNTDKRSHATGSITIAAVGVEHLRLATGAAADGLDLRRGNAGFDQLAPIDGSQIDFSAAFKTELAGDLVSDFVAAPADSWTDGGVEILGIGAKSGVQSGDGFLDNPAG